MPQPNNPRRSFEKVTVVGSGSPEASLDVQSSAGTTRFAVSDAGVTAFTTAVALSSVGGVAPAAGAPTVFWANGVQPLTTTTPGGDSATTATKVFLSAVFVPCNATLTGIGIFNGSAVGTDKAIVALHSSAGVVLKNSALAGTTVTGAAAMQLIPFTATYSAVGPGLYFIGVSYNGTTAKLRTQTVGAGPTVTQEGVFGTLDAITSVPTTFTTAVGPIACTY